MLTVKNEYFANQEIEKLLKNKMNELSDSVDCFDKISAKAFPDEKSDFSESGFTVSGLENVTGRSRKIHVLKWAAISAAAIVCIAVIPKTGFINRVYKNMTGNSVKCIYQNLITEINSETQKNEYLIVDYPLDYYIKNDVLITPLFRCPFEEIDKENVNIRLFIRQINGINTNQIYAAAYVDSYSEENILAAAESNFKFSGEEIEAVIQDISDIEANFSDDNELIDYAVETCFSTNDSYEIINSDNETVSLASFEYTSIFKTTNGIEALKTSVIYSKDTESPDSLYDYDIISQNGNGDIIDISRDDMWHRSMYFNGNSAMPTENISDFTRKDIFADSDRMINEFDFLSIKPYANSDFTWDENIELTLTSGYKKFYSIIPPTDSYSALTLKMYYPSSYTNGIIEVKDGYDFLNSVDTYSGISEESDQITEIYKAQILNLQNNLDYLESIKKDNNDPDRSKEIEEEILIIKETLLSVEEELNRLAESSN